jgi:hypothetical protein
MAKSKTILGQAVIYVAAACVASTGNAQVPDVEDLGQARERLARLEAQFELMQKEFGLEQMKQAQGTWRKQVDEMSTGALPTVTAIFRFDNKWQARLLFDSGVTRLLTNGDLVSPGLKVHDIAETGVTVAKFIPLNQRSPKAKKKNEEEIKLIPLKLTPLNGTPPSSFAQPPSLNVALPNPVPMGR